MTALLGGPRPKAPPTLQGHFSGPLREPVVVRMVASARDRSGWLSVHAALHAQPKCRAPCARHLAAGTWALGPGRRARGRPRLRDCRARVTGPPEPVPRGISLKRQQPACRLVSWEITPARPLHCRHSQVGVENKSQVLFVSKHNPADLTKPFSAKQHRTTSCHLHP